MAATMTASDEAEQDVMCESSSCDEDGTYADDEGDVECLEAPPRSISRSDDVCQLLASQQQDHALRETRHNE